MALSIFQRLTVGFMAIMLLMVCFGGYVVFQLHRLNRIIHLAAGANSRIIRTSESLNTRLDTLVAIEKKFWISKDKDFYLLFSKRENEYLEELNGIHSLLSNATQKAAFSEALALSKAYFKEVEERASRLAFDASAIYESDRADKIRALTEALDQIRQAGLKARNEGILKSDKISARVLRVAGVFAVISILACVVVSLLTTRRIVRPMKVLQLQAREIAAGRFVRIRDLGSPPEIHDLAEDFNTMSERLKELDKLKEDFVSHISHSLRTPLTAVQEASDMLMHNTFDNDPRNREQLLTIVRDECRRLIRTVNRILDLSRMESGMMEYRFASVNLNDTILSVLFRLSPIAQAKQIRLHFEPGSACPPVLADADQLVQLLENLVGNALKFTKSEGRVTLRILGPENDGGKVRVSVADTGRGIEPVHLKNIFDKFRRIERGKGTARGTGLGLAIAKHIAEAHGGDIWVESKIGQGSIFYFSLPFA